jgi:hypothetical protein
MTSNTRWGAELSSRWGHTCLGFWLLNPRACQVHLHKIFISSYENFACCYGTIFSIPIFPLVCLEEILQVLNRDDRKSTSSNCFSIMVLSNLSPWGQVCFYLTCLYYTILFIVKHVFVVFPFLFSFKKGGGGESCRYLFLYLAFQISYVFLPDVSVLGALLFFLLYNWESCLISAKFPSCIYLIDSYFLPLMKMCTIQGSPKVHFFSLTFSLWKF